MGKAQTEQATGTAAELVAALVPAIARMDLPRAVERHGSVEGAADRMIAAIPDLATADPPGGAAYSTAALARWKQISRQGVFAQYRAGRLFAVLHLGKLVFPSCQFDSVGDQLPRFGELLSEAREGVADLAGFASWLHTARPRSGTTPSEELRASGRRGATGLTLPTRSELTVIQPPARTNDTSEQPRRQAFAMVRRNEQATETALRELIQSSDRLTAPDWLRASMRQTDAMHEPHFDLTLFATHEGVLADRIAAIVATTVEESATAHAVALMLGLSVSSVSRRRSAGRLYAFRHAGIWRFASWQFADGDVIPGTSEIVHSVAAQLHPATVRAVMLAPRPTLNAQGRLEPPRDYLLRGGNVNEVLEIFAGMK